MCKSTLLDFCLTCWWCDTCSDWWCIGVMYSDVMLLWQQSTITWGSQRDEQGWEQRVARARNKKLFVASQRSQEGPLEHRESLETSQQLLCSIMMAREIQKWQQWIEILSIFYTERNFSLLLRTFKCCWIFEWDSPELLIITVSLKVVFQIVSACQHLLNSRFVSFTFDYLTIFHHYQARNILKSLRRAHDLKLYSRRRF